MMMDMVMVTEVTIVMVAGELDRAVLGQGQEDDHPVH